MKIGVIGNGYVGKATSLLKCEDIEVLIWDLDEKLRNINEFKELEDCKFVFVCVPTPMNKDGSCHTDIVSTVVEDLIALGITPEHIVIRSTVPVGTSEKLGVSMMPEFLTEANWEKDFKEMECRIVGVQNPNDNNLRREFEEMFTAALWNGKIDSDEFIFCKTNEAELSKLTRNTFLAVKVSFFNEVEEFCSKKSIDYETLIKLVSIDERIGASHTQVPGPDGKRGYGGTCFPKDISSLYNQMVNELGMESFVVESSIRRNLNVDRLEKEWQNEKGRSVI